MALNIDCKVFMNYDEITFFINRINLTLLITVFVLPYHILFKSHCSKSKGYPFFIEFYTLLMIMIVI